MGSSPRVWGQDLHLVARLDVQRIIPTRVGTRFQHCRSQTDNKDHPHACGDKIGSSGHFPPTYGSSPRVWGQGGKFYRSCCITRIIPTRVGTRSMFGTQALKSWDHPHACGDKGTLCLLLTPTRGSSPRVWGQEKRALKMQGRTGIIPTRVGTRISPYTSESFGGDHPHACGDKQKI